MGGRNLAGVESGRIVLHVQAAVKMKVLAVVMQSDCTAAVPADGLTCAKIARGMRVSCRTKNSGAEYLAENK